MPETARSLPMPGEYTLAVAQGTFAVTSWLRQACPLPGADLTPHPDVAVGPDLALPDRHDLLYPLDGVPARLKGWTASWRGDDYGHAGLAETYAPDAVHYGDLAHAPAPLYLRPDLLQLPVCHRAVRLVLEVLDRCAIRLVDPRRAYERGYGSAVRPLGVLDQSPDV